MTIAQMSEYEGLWAVDLEDQQIVGRELVIANLEESIRTFLDYFGVDELMQVVNETI